MAKRSTVLVRIAGLVGICALTGCGENLGAFGYSGGSDRTEEGVGGASERNAGDAKLGTSKDSTAKISFTTKLTSDLTIPYLMFSYEGALEKGVARSVKGVTPTLNIGFEQAQKACESAGWRLCKTMELANACLGEDDLDYMVHATDGSKLKEICNLDSRFASGTDAINKTGDNPDCKAKGADVYDLMGNMAEWSVGPDGEPSLFASSYNRESNVTHCRFYYQVFSRYTFKNGKKYIGYRCCKDL